jgi:squalene synthase HpnC
MALQRLDDWQRQLDQCFDPTVCPSAGTPVRRQVCENIVIPAQAGIQAKDANPVSLDPRLRGGDGNTGTHPVFIALRSLLRHYPLPKEPFADLLVAFRQDQIQQCYATFDDLLHYCRYSADPVGRIVLHLVCTPTAEQFAWSDSICTGLQLANFWQDVRRDKEIGRCYIPQDVARRFDVDLAHLQDSPEFRRMMQELVADARNRFHAGKPLVESVPKRLRADISLFIRGGLAILDAIERVQFNVLATRPSLSRWTKLRLLWGAICGQ